MNNFCLNKPEWKSSDVAPFIKYLKSFGGDKVKCEFEKKIANTSYTCIAVPSALIEKIVKEIHKGNFLSFIDLFIDENYSSLMILGKLIAKIKDFELFKSYLFKYLDLVDSWGLTDCLKLKIPSNKEENFFELSKKLILSPKPFFRRFAIIILFKLVNEKYIDKILTFIASLKKEDEYYVNMAISWLICDSFIKFRDKTLEFLKGKNLNAFTQNKAISKCRDSFRVSICDKDLLLHYKIKA